MPTQDADSSHSTENSPGIESPAQIDRQGWLKRYDLTAQHHLEVDWPRLLLWDLKDRLDQDVLREAIHDIWVAVSAGLIDLQGVPSAPDQTQQRLSPSEWRELFTAAGRYISYEDTGGDPGISCKKPTTLYRYAEHGGEVGWAWTTSRDKAAAFQYDYDAERLRDGCVWKASNFDPGRLLAHFHDKGLTSTTAEDEYVFEPRHDDEITHVEPIQNCPHH